jgi:hypothetical protein
MLTVVLYRHESWSLTLKEGHRLRMFLNGDSGRAFEFKGEEVTGDWRELHEDKNRNL